VFRCQDNYVLSILSIKVSVMGQQISKWEAEEDGAALSGELHRILGVSHRQAKGLIDARCVTVNGEAAKTHGSRLNKGDMVSVNFDTETSYHELPRPSKNASDSVVNILWEDKHLVFLDKPAGILSVPTEHSDDTSLADALVEHYRQQGIKKPRIYIVHRLDRYTTGVMVFAKTPEALDGLRDLFRDHNINRVYVAILVGELPENNGTLYDKVAERTRFLKMAVVARRAGNPRPQGAKPAVTHYRVIERLPGHTVVELKLETGRRNQIRVQFAERGYPLLGDKIYGSTHPALDRQALHAKLLGLRHPVTEEIVTVNSDVPDDMAEALQKLHVVQRVNRAKAGLKGEEGIFKPRITEERKQSRVMRAKRFTEGANRDGFEADKPFRGERRFDRGEGGAGRPPRARSNDGPPRPRARRGDGDGGQGTYGDSAPRTRRYAKRSDDGPPRPRARRGDGDAGQGTYGDSAPRTRSYAKRSDDGPPRPRARRGDGDGRQGTYGDSAPRTRSYAKRSDDGTERPPRPRARKEDGGTDGTRAKRSFGTSATARPRAATRSKSAGERPQKFSRTPSGKSKAGSGTKRPAKKY
jgi:23S rRNA pseudouridine1911/1915/1917 synthase